MTDVGDVHNSGHVIPGVTEIFLKHVLHNVRADVADMCEMVYSRSAGVDRNLAFLSGLELIA
jgi:hypothetical protein